MKQYLLIDYDGSTLDSIWASSAEHAEIEFDSFGWVIGTVVELS